MLNDEYEILVDKLTSANDGEYTSIAKLSQYSALKTLSSMERSDELWNRYM